MSDKVIKAAIEKPIFKLETLKAMDYSVTMPEVNEALESLSDKRCKAINDYISDIEAGGVIEYRSLKKYADDLLKYAEQLERYLKLSLTLEDENNI